MHSLSSTSRAWNFSPYTTPKWVFCSSVTRNVTFTETYPGALRTTVELTQIQQLNGQYRECQSSREARIKVHKSNLKYGKGKKAVKEGEGITTGPYRSVVPSGWTPTEPWNQFKTDQPQKSQLSSRAARHPCLQVWMQVIGWMVLHDNRDSHGARVFQHKALSRDKVQHVQRQQ